MSKVEEDKIYFRYSNARVKTINTTGEPYTATFLIKDDISNEITEKWCFVTENFLEDLKRAIDADLPINILITRSFYTTEEKSAVRDDLSDIWTVHKK